ncbi:hypothetical protein WJX77_012161 [Trebouxia sp. C0004]
MRKDKFPAFRNREKVVVVGFTFGLSGPSARILSMARFASEAELDTFLGRLDLDYASSPHDDIVFLQAMPNSSGAPVLDNTRNLRACTLEQAITWMRFTPKTWCLCGSFHKTTWNSQQ